MDALLLILALLGGPDVSGEELQCLVQTVYFETRSEPFSDQLDVAAVVVNRQGHEDFPDTLCGVVREARKPGLYNCQFTFWCDGKREDMPNREAYGKAVLVALAAVIRGPDPAGATHYHADHVSPDWPDLVEVSRNRRHIFYSN